MVRVGLTMCVNATLTYEYEEEIMTSELHDTQHPPTEAIVMDYIHRMIMHHAMWYGEVRHQLGRETADEIIAAVLKKTVPVQLQRIGETVGFGMKDGIPEPIANMDEEGKNELKSSLAKNWLANDGIWFQAIEFSRNMFDAKRINDACWAQFSPFEASSIKRMLNLGEKPGLEGLKKALQFRLYASLNTQSIIEESENSFVFQMNECRVQTARKRKKLDDYPCKSAGMIEYPSFATAIDPRIRTECIGCPPDKHPDNWFCAWRFTLPSAPMQRIAPESDPKKTETENPEGGNGELGAYSPDHAPAAFTAWIASLPEKTQNWLRRLPKPEQPEIFADTCGHMEAFPGEWEPEVLHEIESAIRYKDSKYRLIRMMLSTQIRNDGREFEEIEAIANDLFSKYPMQSAYEVYDQVYQGKSMEELGLQDEV